MRRLMFIIFVVAVVAALSAISHAGPILRIRLDGDIITPVAAEYITTSIDKAEKDGAACLIIELDTPGGLLSSTRSIVKAIMNARVPVAVFVAPKGARAGSAGVFITLSAAVAAMAPSTNIGAAHPVNLGEKPSKSDSFEEMIGRLFTKEGAKKPDESKKPKERKEPMDEKVLNDSKAWAAAIAKDRGRNSDWAQRAVAESISATDEEALKLGIIDFIASDTADLIAKMDGRSVDLPSGRAVIRTAGSSIIEVPKTFRLRWLSALAHPNIAYILLMLGFYGLLFELGHPGAAFPGIAGAICLILAFFSLQVLPTNYAGVALIVLAIAMFLAEIKVVSYGLLTIGGVISLLLGSLILFPSADDYMRVSIPIILAFTLSTLAVAGFLAFVVLRSHRRRAVTGEEGLVGERGQVRDWSGGRGRAFVHGELWDAVSDEMLAAGENIEVISVSGMTLTIKKGDICHHR